jgi:hypothetical protein
MTGETRTILWRIGYEQPPPLPPTLNITLRRENDKSFRLPLTTYYDTKMFRYAWKIPQDLGSNDDYYIRVIPNRADPVGRPNIKASKSKTFTIVNKNMKPVRKSLFHDP